MANISPLLSFFPDDRLVDTWEGGAHQRLPKWRLEWEDALRAGEPFAVPSSGRANAQAPSVPIDSMPQPFFPKPWGPAVPSGGTPVFPGFPQGYPTLPWNPVPMRPRTDVNATPEGLQNQNQGPRYTNDQLGLTNGTLAQQQTPAPITPDQQVGNTGMDPRRGIQQGTDPGFGSYQPSAADFGEKQQQQAQQQSAGMSDAGMWGLLAAGLGILANNYGNYGQAAPAIGKGGMMGLQTFLGERQVQERNKFAQQELDQRKEQVGINRQVMEGQLAAQQRAAALAQRRDGLLEKFRGAKDPNEKMAIMEELALLSDSDAAFGAVMRAKNGSKKYIKGREGIPGQPDMQREVLIDPETMTPVWQGDPMKKGALVHVDASDRTESKFGEKYGGAQGERANAIEQMADKAASQLHQTNVMYDVAKQWRQSGGQLGAAGNIQALATGAIQAIGGDPTRLGLPKDAGPAQTLEAISNTFVLSKIGGEGGMPANNFSNADLQFLQATKPRVVNTAEGFVLTLMLERGAARRAMQMDEMFQNELDAFPPDQERRAYRSFRRKWQEFVNSNSAWTPEEMAEIKAMKKGLGAQGTTPSGTRTYNPETGRIE
jgi:hypothetical protein